MAGGARDGEVDRVCELALMPIKIDGLGPKTATPVAVAGNVSRQAPGGNVAPEDAIPDAAKLTPFGSISFLPVTAAFDIVLEGSHTCT